jgi:long-chain acyl-CoA synthetase
MPRQSIAELVTRFEQIGSEPAYVFRRGYRTLRWSYADLARTARQFSTELAHRGIASGERVMLWAPNSAEWVAAFFGCALRGVAVVPMDQAAAPEFALRVAKQVSARLIVCSQDMERHVAGIPSLAIEQLAQSVAANTPDNSPIATTRTDILQIIFTSGTTSEPRGVIITHGNVLANLEPLEREIGKYLRYERFFHPLRLLDLLPLSHVFGQFLGIFVPQVLATTVVFHDSLNPTEIVNTIREERVSAAIAVPRVVQSLKQKLERDIESSGRLEKFRARFAAAEGKHLLRRWWRFRDLRREFGWKFFIFISGGAALDEETETFWSRLGFPVIQGYGLTETTSLISVNHPFHAGRRSIGKPLPGREVKLAPDGEIMVRGENIASSYWQAGGKAASSIEDGWLRTGDLGEFGADGSLYFKGRKKNVIVAPSGMNIYPEDLEAALNRQSGVRDVAVVGVPSGSDTEACAVLLLDASTNADDVIRAANRELADYQQLRRWIVWPQGDFPRTSTRKPKIGEIEQFARAQIAGAPAPAATSTVASLIQRISGKQLANVAPGASLDDLNLSSIDRVELLSALEDRYQLDLADDCVTANTTLADLERQLAAPESGEGQYVYPRWVQRWPIPWIRNFAYHALTRPYTWVMARPEIIGEENLRDVRGPVLVVSNHVTYIDIGFILYALPWRLRTKLAVAMQGRRLMEMRTPPREWSWIERLANPIAYALTVALFNVFPLPQRSGFRRSFEYAGESADRGYSIMIFPEGHRAEDGEIAAFQAGAGMLAQRLNIPVVPMRIDGLWGPAHAHRHYVSPGTIKVRIGTPVRYGTELTASAISQDLERRVREL